MKFIFSSLCVLILLVISACQSNTEVIIPEPEPTIATLENTEVIAKSAIDFDQDGEDETLSVRMISGELKEAKMPEAITGNYWEGMFRLELADKSGKLIHKLDLNANFGSKPLIFEQNRPFEITFADYNNDGYSDFSIGQHIPAIDYNFGFNFNLYSLLPDGIKLLQSDLITAANSYSVLFKKAGNTSFESTYYNLDKGAYEVKLYTWQSEQFVAADCQSCVVSLPKPHHSGVPLTLEKADNGFQLVYGGKEEDFSVIQTLISPAIDNKSYAIHIIRTLINEPIKKFKIDAVVVDPEKENFRIYPMYEVLVNEGNPYDQVAKVYGFLDDQHFVYVSVLNSIDSPSSMFYYAIEKLNVLTGENTSLITEISKLPENEHFAPSWLNDTKDTLVLNSYTEGKYWTYNLINPEGSLHDQRFRHPYPFFTTIPSPDGEVFWYSDYDREQFRLYTTKGKPLAKAPFNNGHKQYPVFGWSPDSQYAIYQDTKDRSTEHLISNQGEMPTVAPQRILFYEKHGTLIHNVQTESGSNKYVEVAGWVDNADGLVLLHHYELSPLVEEKKNIINSTYKLLDLNTLTTSDLRVETDLSKMNELTPVRLDKIYFDRTDQPIFGTDTKSLLLTIVGEHGKWISEPADHQPTWLIDGTEITPTTAYTWIKETKQISQIALNKNAYHHFTLDDNWIVSGDMEYKRIK